VKTLESKETKASKEITVTHNSVFAAHRLQCRMTIHKIDIRHFVCASSAPSFVALSIFPAAKHARRQAASDLRA
jgi:hypothetical protein